MGVMILTLPMPSMFKPKRSQFRHEVVELPCRKKEAGQQPMPILMAANPG